VSTGGHLGRCNPLGRKNVADGEQFSRAGMPAAIAAGSQPARPPIDDNCCAALPPRCHRSPSLSHHLSTTHHHFQVRPMLDLSSLQIGALVASLVLTGVIAGILAGLLGVGGGIVIVPVLFWVFGLLAMPAETSMHLAVGTSLATIVATSWASMRAHSRRGSVDKPLLHLWGPAIFAGAAVGGVAAKYIDGNGLRLIFGIIALLVSINMALPRQLKVSDELPPSPWINRTIAAVIGLFSALMGTGGGTLSVPTLAAFSFPIHRAVGTASFIGMLIGIPAVVGFIWSGYGVADRPPLSLGFVSLPAVALIFPMTMIMAPVGVRLAHRLNQRRLKIAFAVFLFITAARMLYTSVGKYL
jgi:uncharacterized membrane protein YfcA